jgi:hypothetical protein
MFTKLRSKSRNGQAFVELALVLPMLVLLLLSMIEVVFIGRAYLALLDSSYQGAHLGSQGLILYDNSEVNEVVKQDLIQKGYYTSSLIDVIIVRADLPGGKTISNYHVYNMMGSGRATALTQGLLVGRLRADSPAGQLIAVDIVFDYPLLFNWPNVAGLLPNPFPLHAYTIQYVARK